MLKSPFDVAIEDSNGTLCLRASGFLLALAVKRGPATINVPFRSTYTLLCRAPDGFSFEMEVKP